MATPQSPHETSAETMSNCVKYFKERLHQETETNAFRSYYAEKKKYDKIELTDYANYLIDKAELKK
jgi:hypothetical protein